MDRQRRVEILKLLLIWGVCFLLSLAALSISLYTYAQYRDSFSCENDGHYFEARYEAEVPSADEIAKLDMTWSSDKKQAIEKLTREVYIQDVCRYCGKTIPRTGQ